MNLIKIIKQKKEIQIALILLAIPTFLSIILLYPRHEEFITTGDIVSVQELGVEGNVYFTYVNSGVTNDLLDKFSVSITSPGEIEFYPLNEKEYENYGQNMEVWEQYKDLTINNAVQNAEKRTTGNQTDKIQSRIDEIIQKSSGYVGDSFGLMLAIGLIEEMNHMDFSRNNRFKIAGTGTIEEDGTVGPVGAIRLKLLTAEMNHVDVFFVPEDRYYYEDSSLSNQVTAERVVQNEHLNLQLVPVATLDEALNYLKNYYPLERYY